LNRFAGKSFSPLNEARRLTCSRGDKVSKNRACSLDLSIVLVVRWTGRRQVILVDIGHREQAAVEDLGDPYQ
jgi:hypothetical protein